MALSGKLLPYAEGAEPNVGLGWMNPPFPPPRRFTAAELSCGPWLPHLRAFPLESVMLQALSLIGAGAEDFGTEGEGWWH